MNLTPTQLGLVIVIVAAIITLRTKPKTLWEGIEQPLAYALGIMVVGLIISIGGPKAVGFFGRQGTGLLNVVSGAGLGNSVTVSGQTSASPYTNGGGGGQPSAETAPAAPPEADLGNGGGSSTLAAPTPLPSQSYTETLTTALYSRLELAWQQGNRQEGYDVAEQILAINPNDTAALAAQSDLARTEAMLVSRSQLGNQTSFPNWLSGEFVVGDLGAVRFRRTENEVSTIVDRTPGWSWGESFKIARLALASQAPNLKAGDAFSLDAGQVTATSKQ